MSIEIAAGLVRRAVENGSPDHNVIRADKVLQRALTLPSTLTEGQVRDLITTCRSLDHAADTMIAFLRSRGVPVGDGS